MIVDSSGVCASRQALRDRGDPVFRSQACLFLPAVLLTLVIALAASGCSSSGGTVVRPTSTGKTIKSATAPLPSDQPVIETSVEGAPGVTDLEIYEGTGEFINKEAARVDPKPVAEDGEIVLNFEGE